MLPLSTTRLDDLRLAAHTPASVRHHRIALTVSLAVVAGLALVPTVASAGRSHGGAAVGHGRPSGVHHGGVHHGGAIHHLAPRPHHGAPRHFGPRPFVRRGVQFGVIAATPLVYGPPLVYGSPMSYDAGSYAPPVSDVPPVSYGGDMGGAISLAPSPPSPTVVEFPAGRYELRGDGMATPYTWVWIPNPPSAPPAASRAAPGPGDPSPSSHRRLYRWIDEAGVAHWTDRLDAVPQSYRAQAQQPRLH